MTDWRTFFLRFDALPVCADIERMCMSKSTQRIEFCVRALARSQPPGAEDRARSAANRMTTERPLLAPVRPGSCGRGHTDAL